MTSVAPNRGQSQGQGTYTFASQPRAVPQRPKYRSGKEADYAQNEGPPEYGNIMYDRRIVRGNTYAQHTLPANAQPDPIEIQRQQEARRRAIAHKRARRSLRPRTPDAVEGRKHIDVQTELYLEELSDRVEETDATCQTDAFLDRPPSPLFIPAKTGNDMETQIYEGELFHFDIESKPILEVLVGKTVEQSLLEVMEEEELSNLRMQQCQFEELRNAELVEQQRLEEQERRHREEKERRMMQQKEVLRKEHETTEKIAAHAFAQSYLADLVPTVFGTLSDNGYFYDPVERDVEQGFLPWLMGEVEVRLQQAVISRMLLDDLIRCVVTRRNNMHASSGKLTASKSLRSGASKSGSRKSKKGKGLKKGPKKGSKKLATSDATVTGSVTSHVTGGVTSHVTGDLGGGVTGRVTSHVTGGVTSKTSAVTGDVTGDDV